MWMCEGSKIDWTAVAAIFALGLWLSDQFIRSRERKASRRLLAQIMITPVGFAQLAIAKFRSHVVPPEGGDMNYLWSLIESQAARQDLASRAELVTLELLPQFLDKADLFGATASNRLAFAYSHIDRLKGMTRLLSELNETAGEQVINDHIKQVLSQIQETEKVIGEAYQALLKEGRASFHFHVRGRS